MSFEFHNVAIECVTLKPPAGCMSECQQYVARFLRSGAVEYCGIENVDRLGEHKGSVNCYILDYIFAMIESSGLLSLPKSTTFPLSSVGDWTLAVTRNGATEVWVHNHGAIHPIMFCACRLLESELTCAVWSLAAYNEAVATFPARLDGTFGVVEVRESNQPKRRECGYF